MLGEKRHGFLTREGYEAAISDINRKTVMRYSRGNARLRQGRYMTQADLDDLRARGDAARKSLYAFFKRHGIDLDKS